MRIKSAVWSNIFFLVPLGLAFYAHLLFCSLLILGAMVFSILYHLSEQKKFALLDKVFAYAVIGYNFYLCYLSNFRQPYFYLALLFVIIGLYFLYQKKKDDYEWHAAAALITIFCILAVI